MLRLVCGLFLQRMNLELGPTAQVGGQKTITSLTGRRWKGFEPPEKWLIGRSAIAQTPLPYPDGSDILPRRSSLSRHDSWMIKTLRVAHRDRLAEILRVTPRFGLGVLSQRLGLG
jgi:hypothetical protein